MDISFTNNHPIAIKKEAPEISFPLEDDSKLPELYMTEVHKLYKHLPKERKATAITSNSIIMEAANYVLELEKSLQESKQRMKDVSVEKIPAETFPLSPREEIKRPMNAFIRFSMEYRAEMASRFPNLDNRKVSRLLGFKWKKMSEKERKPYEEEFKEEIKGLHERNPNWLYTSKTNPTEEHSNTVLLPTRLRPKNKRKRKVFLDCVEEDIYPKSSRQISGCKRRRRKKTPAANAKPSDVDNDSLDLWHGFCIMPPPEILSIMDECSLELEETFNLFDTNRNINIDFLSIDL